MENADQELERRKNAYEYAWKFAQLQKQALVNLESTSSSSVTYSRFTQETLLSYMQTPKSNEKNIRNASIYMYDASPQYRRLIQYYALMPMWALSLIHIYSVCKSDHPYIYSWLFLSESRGYFR